MCNKVYIKNSNRTGDFNMGMLSLSRLYNNSKAIRNMALLASFLIFSPIIIILYALKPFYPVKLVRIRDDRIGNLVMNTEVFLRRIKLGIYKKNVFYIGIAGKNPSNKQLLKMFKRAMFIIQVSKPVEILFNVLSNKRNYLKDIVLYLTFVDYDAAYYEFNNAGSSLQFNKKEEKEGQDLLEKMKAKGSWFACFHARDSSYLKKTFEGMDSSYHNYRDCNIENYLKAAEYITKQGGYAIRMGSVVEKKLQHLKNKKIIDYAANFRTDFGDIYLLAKCKFFLSSTSGLFQVSTLFDVPVAHANLIPIEYPTFRKEDLFIPTKIWSKKKKRFLAFNEIIKSGAGVFLRTDKYEKAGLVSVENTPEEILDLAVEMNERLDGKWKTTKKDEELQKRYRLLFAHSRCYGFPSRIGAKFLRKNKFLLE